MPLYEFQCERCGRLFEKVLPLSEADGPWPPCPDCGSTETKKLMSAGRIDTGDMGGYRGKVR